MKLTELNAHAETARRTAKIIASNSFNSGLLIVGRSYRFSDGANKRREDTKAEVTADRDLVVDGAVIGKIPDRCYISGLGNVRPRHWDMLKAGLPWPCISPSRCPSCKKASLYSRRQCGECLGGRLSAGDADYREAVLAVEALNPIDALAVCRALGFSPIQSAK